MKSLSKFATFQKCNADDVEVSGSKVCKNEIPIKVEKNDTSFFSPSGNYKIDFLTTEINNEGQMFLVKANPNGNNFANEGSAVIGCFSPLSGIKIIKEYSSKNIDKGQKPYITCGIKTNIARAPPPIKGCMDPLALNYNPLATIPDPDKPCEFPEDTPVKGCMDPLALNYNPLATIPDPDKPCEFPEGHSC